MIRKIGVSLLCAAALFSADAYSIQTNVMQTGSTLVYELKPNDPQMFINYMYWEVTANCKITTVDSGDELYAEALAKQGKINDITLTKGNTLSVTVHQDETLKITAAPGAKVRITNHGNHTVKATCVA